MLAGGERLLLRTKPNYLAVGVLSRVPLEPDLVRPAPFTHRLEDWSERHAVGRNRITDVWRNVLFFVPQKYSVRNHFLQMAD